MIECYSSTVVQLKLKMGEGFAQRLRFRQQDKVRGSCSTLPYSVWPARVRNTSSENTITIAKVAVISTLLK